MSRGVGHIKLVGWEGEGVAQKKNPGYPEVGISAFMQRIYRPWDSTNTKISNITPWRSLSVLLYYPCTCHLRLAPGFNTLVILSPALERDTTHRAV